MEKIRLTNSYDEDKVRGGYWQREQVRSVEIDALVDTGATMLILPADVVEQLGLKKVAARFATPTAEPTKCRGWAA